MIQTTHEAIEKQYKDFLAAKEFPCVAARAALTRQQLTCIVVDHMACPKDDITILNFLYDFIDNYRNSESLFHSASVIFKGPEGITEDQFEMYLWQRLQSLANLDAKNFKHDARVDSNPASGKFGFSLKKEALFMIGLHPSSSRLARRFAYPAIAFNPHNQFEQLRMTDGYNKMKNIVRKRDLAYSGSINPMLRDFGDSSEAFQYSGRMYDNNWVCPLNLKHEPVDDNSTT